MTALRSIGSLLAPGLLLAAAAVALWAGTSRGPAPCRTCPAEGSSLPGAEACSLAVSPDATLLATGSVDGVVQLWDAEARRPLARWQAHEQKVTALAFSPGRRELLTSGAEGAVRRWSLGEKVPRLVSGWTSARFITALAAAPDGQALAVASAGRLELRDPASGELLPGGELAVPGGLIRALAFAPGGDALAAGGGGDNAIRVWALGGTRPELRLTLEGHSDNWVRGLAYSSDGGTLVSLDTEGLAIAWGREGNLLGRARVARPTCFLAALGGRLVLTAEAAGPARLLRLSADWWR
jgi:WD40 repeat protein